MKNQVLTMLSAIGLMLLFAACQQSGQSEQAADASAGSVIKGQAYVNTEGSTPNILQVAMGSPDHTTLTAGVAAAGLENVLANNGPLTVFAPTNTAFDKLPEGVLEDLLKPENKAKLAAIITFHAAPGTYGTELTPFKDGQSLFMATGENVKVEVREDGSVYVHGTKILGTVIAANGVVHVVDDVFLPE